MIMDEVTCNYKTKKSLCCRIKLMLADNFYFLGISAARFLFYFFSSRKP